MPTLFVKRADAKYPIHFSSGKTILKILNNENISINAGCGGYGRCGLCKVIIKNQKIKVASKTLNPPTTTELNSLSEEQIAQGIRLACNTTVYGDLQIEILNHIPIALWRDIKKEEYITASPISSILPHYILSKESEFSAISKFDKRTFTSPSYPNKKLGVAVDLGTTHIRITLWDMRSGVRLSGRCGINPQSSFGSDVLTRLALAVESKEQLYNLRDLVKDAIADEICAMAMRQGCTFLDISHILIVGNSAMLAILSGKNYKELLMPQNWGRDIGLFFDNSSDFYHSWGFPADTKIEFIEPIGGFVGSDIIAGLLSTELTQSSCYSLFVDFGTNSEIAFWDGKSLWITSAAGGPAFEGGQIVGSSFVDIISQLIKAGAIKANGRVTGKCDKNGSLLVKDFIPDIREEISIKKRDIDMFQRAKAAVGAGILSILNQAGVRIDSVKRICICGVFGSYLNIKNAQDIGLLPSQIAPDRIEMCGNSALAGCEIMLFDPNRTSKIKLIKNSCKIINLSDAPEFEDMFIRNLQLLPIT